MKSKLYQSSKLALIGTSLFQLTVLQGEAQTLQRQSIGSCGGSAQMGDVSIQQTIGQSYYPVGYYTDEVGFRPGFQQLSNFRLEPSKTINNIILSIFPNPTALSVTIKSKSNINNAKIKIVDISGKLIISENIPELTTHVINFDNWPNGSYLITVYDEQYNNYSTKLVISK